MRNHLLRILAVLFTVCLGACLFVACGDTENTENPNEDPDKYEIIVVGESTTVDVEFDEEGPYESGTVVKFAVLIAPGANLRVVSVKADGTDLAEGSDHKYTVTVGNSDIVVTVETEKVPSHDLQYTVTATGEHATVTFDQNGPYTTGTVVTFTVTAEKGYEVVSVKNGSETLKLGSDNKYSVTVGNSNIVITVETKSTSVPPATQYSVTVGGDANNVTVAFDQNGPYTTGTVVKFTVTAKQGYELVSVKNGSETLKAGSDNKYSVTVGTSNIVITVETRSTSTPSNKTLTAFENASLIQEADKNVQIVIRVRATGYASAEEMKGDVKLLIGTKEIAAFDANLADDGLIYNLFYRTDVSALGIADGSSAEVKLRSAAAGRDYSAPASRVDETLNTVTFGQEKYTLKLENSALVLAFEIDENIQKALSFAGTAFQPEGQKIYLVINLDNVQGYLGSEILAAKLRIGSLEFSPAADGKSNEKSLFFYIAGESVTVTSLSDGKYPISLVVGEEVFDFPTVNGEQHWDPIQLEEVDYSLSVEEQGGAKKLLLTVAGGTPAVTDPIEGVWTGKAKTDESGPEFFYKVLVKKRGGGVDLVVLRGSDEGTLAPISAWYYPKLGENSYGETGENKGSLSYEDGKLTLVTDGTVTLSEHSAELGSFHVPASGAYSDAEGRLTVTFGAQPKVDLGGQSPEISVELYEVGEYTVCYEVGGQAAGIIEANVVLSAGASANKLSALLVSAHSVLELTKATSQLKEIKQTGDLDFYADDYFKLPVSEDDLAWIKENVDSVKTDGIQYPHNSGKGYLIDGAVIQIQAEIGAKGSGKQSFEIVWYNAAGEAVAMTTATRTYVAPPAPTEYTVTVTGVDAEKGSYTLTPAAEGGKYQAGAQVKLTITCNGNRTVENVKIGDVYLKADDSGDYPIPIEGQKAEIVVLVTFKENDAVSYGEEGASVGSWRYWNDGVVTIGEVKFAEGSGTERDIHAVFSATGDLGYGFQLFYNPETYAPLLGKQYTLSMTINAKAACTVTVNSQNFDLKEGDNPISVVFTYSYTGEYQGVSYLDVQVVVKGGESYDLLFKNIAWKEVGTMKKGEVVGGTPSEGIAFGGRDDATAQGNTFKLWWVQDTEWGRGEVVTMTPSDAAQAYHDGKVSFTYSGGSVNYSVQLFYNNTNLTAGKQYYVTLKVKLTASSDLTVQVNGTDVTLKAGQVNDVEVLFTNGTVHAIEIILPGTNFEGVQPSEIGIEISDIQWYQAEEVD